MNEVISEHALDRLFRQARTQNGWLPKTVGDDDLHQLYG